MIVYAIYIYIYAIIVWTAYMSFWSGQVWNARRGAQGIENYNVLHEDMSQYYPAIFH